MNGNHFEKPFEFVEVARVARIERELGGERSGRDKQIEGAPTARFPSRVGNGGVDATVGAGDGSVYRQRLERRLSPLEPVLTTSALVSVAGRMRAGGKLRQRHCRDCDLRGQISRIEPSEVDHDGRVDEAALMTGFSHVAADAGRGPRRRRL